MIWINSRDVRFIVWRDKKFLLYGRDCWGELNGCLWIEGVYVVIGFEGKYIIVNFIDDMFCSVVDKYCWKFCFICCV